MAEEVKDAILLLPSDRVLSSQGSLQHSNNHEFKENLTPKEKEELLSKYELVKSRKIQYDKPILIIYNP